MSALDSLIANAPLAAIGAAFITVIAVLSAAALAGRSNSLAQKASDDGEGPSRG